MPSTSDIMRTSRGSDKLVTLQTRYHTGALTGSAVRHQTFSDIMNRPYRNIPQAGRHLGSPDKSEPTTSVRALAPVQPLRKSKVTDSMHVLSVNKEKGIYRLDVVPADRADSPVEGFQELVRIPAGGDWGGLLEQIPQDSQHVVLENTTAGLRKYQSGSRLSRTWATEGTYNRVTFFSDQSAADEYTRAVKEGEAAGQ